MAAVAEVGGAMRYRVWTVLAAVGLLALAYLCRAEVFLVIGLLDDSLTSDNPLTRHTAQLEIRAAQGLLGIGAVLMFAVGIWGERIAATGWARALRSLPDRLTPGGEALRLRLFGPSLAITLAATVVITAYAVWGDRFLSFDMMGKINFEDGLIENCQAIFFALAGVLSLIWAAKGRPNGGRRFTWLLLGLGFIFLTGEEISWGQRIFGFATPEAMEAINVQKEFNLHNLLGYLFDHLFILGFFLWGAVLPLLYQWVADLRRIVVATGFPLPSAGLAVGMVLASLMQEPLVTRVFVPVGGLRVAEIREFLSALCFLLLMYEVGKLHHVGRAE